MSESQKRGRGPPATGRRKFIAGIGGLSAVAGLSAAGWLTSSLSASALAGQNDSLSAQLEQAQQTSNKLRDELTATQNRLGNAQNVLANLSEKWILYGGGSNLKYMPDSSGNLTVPLEEVFYFDFSNAICRVENNPQEFVMPTYKLGKVAIDANTFYMAMIATQVQIDSIKQTQGGAKAVLKGTLQCATRAGSAGITIGSRTSTEPASFNVLAVADPQNPSFAYTAIFDPYQAPVNYSIFGPSATFTGKLTSGNIIVKQVENL